jgi:DNA-binding response OmpR family regulator
MDSPSTHGEPLDHKDEPRFGQCDVLVVDNDPLLRRAAAEALQEVGYRVISARDGADALRVLEFATPWLVVLEVHLPVMGGVELVHELRRREFPIKILVMGAGDVRQWAQEIKADGHLVKPFAIRELLAEVNSIDPSTGWFRLEGTDSDVR